ncbi:MAG TPA: hypothetical protein VFS30_10265 [Dehalococcoidia bacterium]|nr:hypothetical protein [Dehalococcoidia bacterium]
MPEEAFDVMELDIEDANPSAGKTLIYGLVGGDGNIYSMRVVGRVLSRGVRSMESLELATFDRFGAQPIELLSGTNRTNAQDAISAVRRGLLSEGWAELPSGRYWFNHRFRKGRAGGVGSAANLNSRIRAAKNRDAQLGDAVIMIGGIAFFGGCLAAILGAVAGTTSLESVGLGGFILGPVIFLFGNMLPHTKRK